MNADLTAAPHTARPVPPNDGPPRPVMIFGSFRYGQYFEDILTGVVGAAERAGGGVVLMQAADGVLPSSLEIGGQDAVSRAAWDHVDGAVVVLRSVSDAYVQALRGAGKYVVAVGQVPRAAQAAVRIDNEGGVRQAVTHLAEHGHTRIAFHTPTWQADAAERRAAYERTMVDLGLEPLPPLLSEDSPTYSMDGLGHHAGRVFAEDPKGVTAALVAPDRVAIGFLRAVQEAGIAVPHDLAVVGIDDVAAAAVCTPPLSTVAISFVDVGAIAYEAVLRGVRGSAGADITPVPQRLVLRESCGCGGETATVTAHPHLTPAETFVRAFGEAARDASVATGADAARADAVARRVVDAVASTDGTDRTALAALAADVVSLCPLDRSVTTVLGAVRALAAAVAGGPPGRPAAATHLDPGRVVALVDAVRTAQLQQRLADLAEMTRLQGHHYSIELALLGRDRTALHRLGWLADTPAESAALALWDPPGTRGRVRYVGRYDRPVPTAAPDHGPLSAASAETVAVQAFPPADLFADPTRNRLVVISQVRFGGSDWGVFATGGGAVMRSTTVQATLQKWAVLMSTSLDRERADADLERQGRELQAAYDKELALLEEVRISEERYALAAEAAQDALWDWDLDRDTVFYSPRWKALLGHHDDEIGNSPQEWLDRIHPEDVAAVRAQLAAAFAGTSQYLDVEHRLRTSTGEYRWMAGSGRVVTSHGRTTRVVGSFTDVTVRRVLQDRLVHEALFDPLTGLAKKTLLLDRLTQAVEHAKRRPEYRFALLFLDLDGFKAVNDTLGHAAGDEVLATIAERLRNSLRSKDTAARLGGDEFSILLDDADLDELPTVVDRFRQVVVAPVPLATGEARVGVSIGTATSQTASLDAESILHDADLAMYREKRRHR